MIRPATLPLAGGRWEPFIYTIEFPGVDLTGATFLMQIRIKPDASGTALISLVAAASTAQGLSITVTDGSTTLQIRINETTMEGLPKPVEVGDNSVLYYDLQVTRPGVHEKTRYFVGTFTAESGVTNG